MISGQELITIVNVGLIFGIAAVGIYITFRTVNFADLTCDGSFVTGAAISSMLIKSGGNPYIAMAASLLAGGLSGAVTGFLNVKLKITDLLAGIVVAFMLYSVNLRIMNDSPNITFIDDITIFTNNNLSVTVLVILMPLVLGLIFLLSSGFGLKLRATGYNKKFASTSGINVGAMTVAGVVISNALVAFAGSLFSQYQGFCDISQGTGTLVTGLTAVVLGEKILPFKKAPLAILSCMLGAVLYRTVIYIALHSNTFGIRTQDLNLITGIVIILTIIIKRKREQNA
ncbi:MAG: hypothetical protein LBQ43_03360 [Holosporales bacterium]|jgi:putative ABC transport system permease protein|nr:hypothetical protein [Holosporales bacterium]